MKLSLIEVECEPSASAEQHTQRNVAESGVVS